MPPNLQPPKKDFFVSYNQADRDWAKWIAAKLEDEGYTCVLQAWDFRPGGNFVLDMHEAAQRTKHTIAVLSPAYLNALFTQSEWAAAFVQDPTSANRKLIPVRVQSCTPEGILAAIGYIDLVGLDEQTALTKLLQGVKRERAKPDTSPGFPGGGPSSSFPRSTPTTSSLEILIVNAEEDEAFRKEIEKRLRPMERTGQITIWHISKSRVGDVSQDEIDTHFYRAKFILLLVSPDFLDSENCRVLTNEAMKRSKNQEVRVIPIIIRPCYWKDSPFHTLVTIPRNEKAINQWPNKDAAYLEITEEIRKVLSNP